MKRFRFTLLAICLVLLFLGWNDISLFLRNRAPENIAITDLEQDGAPREWLHVTGGTFDLLEAISTSGSIDLEALLVPLKSDPQAGDFRVLVETRDPRLVKLFQTYHFKLNSEEAQKRYLAEHRAEFFPRQDVSGTLVTGLIATGNRDKLMTLAKDVGMHVTDDVIFIAEGKKPARIRGFLFFALALAGLVKFATMGKKEPLP
jgi:hypothetical protein